LVLSRKANTVAVAVVDNGADVPPGSEETIFEPYRSAHDQARQPGSVGLGLALSRSLARLMHGDVTYSRRGQNTWFELTLPAAGPGD
jgi:signal transduction histidine kinase